MTVRTAAASLMIFGGVVIVALSVGSAWYAIANPSWVDAQLAGTDPLVREQLDALLTPEAITQVAIACGVAGAAEGGLSILLGWLVARGRRWAIGTSIAVTFFRLALVGLLLVATLVSDATITLIDTSAGTAHTATYGNPVAASSAWPTIATLVVATVVLIATLACLFRSRHATPPALPPTRK